MPVVSLPISVLFSSFGNKNCKHFTERFWFSSNILELRIYKGVRFEYNIYLCEKIAWIGQVFKAFGFNLSSCMLATKVYITQMIKYR